MFLCVHISSPMIMHDHMSRHATADDDYDMIKSDVVRSRVHDKALSGRITEQFIRSLMIDERHIGFHRASVDTRLKTQRG